MSRIARPDRKVVAGGFAGAVVVVAVWCLRTFAAFEMPPEIAAALTTVVAGLVAYFVPNA